MSCFQMFKLSSLLCRFLKITTEYNVETSYEYEHIHWNKYSTIKVKFVYEMYRFYRFSKWRLPIYELPINQISDVTL